MNKQLYFSFGAIGAPERYFFDGLHVYERVQGLGSLGQLDGWLKKIGKKIKKVAKKAVKFQGKILKSQLKLVKGAAKIGAKVVKANLKMIKKALPIANAALTFIPGVGWAAKAALTVAEMGFNAYDAAKARKAAKKAAAQNNETEESEVQNEINQEARATPASVKVTKVTPVTTVPPQANVVRVNQQQTTQQQGASLLDFMKINKAVTANNSLTTAQILAIAKMRANNSYVNV